MHPITTPFSPALSVPVLMAAHTLAAQTNPPKQDIGWPRQVVKPGGTLVYYQPQIDEWRDGKELRGAGRTVAGYRTSSGDRSVVARGQNGTIARVSNYTYAGRDGNVYRKDAGGSWSQYSGGGWNHVDTSGVRSEADRSAQNARPKRVRRAAHHAGPERFVEVARERLGANPPLRQLPVGRRPPPPMTAPLAPLSA